MSTSEYFIFGEAIIKASLDGCKEITLWPIFRTDAISKSLKPVYGNYIKIVLIKFILHSL